MLKKYLTVLGMLSLAASGTAMAQDGYVVQATGVEQTVSPQDYDKIEKQETAIRQLVQEALRLSQGCMAGDPGDCHPLEPCDAQGQRKSGRNCVLVWKQDDQKVDHLAWVERWEVPQYRLPALGVDGKLY